MAASVGRSALCARLDRAWGQWDDSPRPVMRGDILWPIPLPCTAAEVAQNLGLRPAFVWGVSLRGRNKTTSG
ncbi:hypothetical protein PHAMO_50010 [Magnetospirillum molischianum DSM 120]|uniref:Uncharacterized protein n=1 Tax=Magnetospirillum molischianum DSM 120 TaxID=1150626 RepID=H8FWX7_MAGML|nr:hypothetical protein PHAMO_50010 [Magnetospirillum molischianum DSM 120]